MLLSAALAQALAAAAPEAASAPAQSVIRYPPEFFAAAGPQNAFEMVQRLPGFSIETGDAVRGFEGAAGNVLIDGERPTSKSDNLEEILKRLPASQVARIDLIRGGAPGIDMQGKSVLANVVRKTGGGFRGVVAFSNNSVYDGRNKQGYRLEGSGKLGDRAWEVGILVGSGIDDGAGEGPHIILDPAGRPLQLGQVDSEGNAVQITLTGAVESPVMGGRLRLNTRLAQNPFDYDEVDVVSLPARLVETTHFFDDIRQGEFGARYTRGLFDKATMEMVGLAQRKEEVVGQRFSNGTTGNDFRLESQTGETIGRGVVKYRWSETLSLEAGGEAAFNWLESETRFAQAGVAVRLPAADVRVEETRHEVFAKGTWRPRPSLTVEAGIRREGSDIASTGDVALEKSLTFTKPRIALTWAPNDRTQLRLRFERIVGQLNFRDFVASSSASTGLLTAGNPDLEPEQAWVSEAAVERRFLGSGAVVLTIRHSALTDVVDRAPIFGPSGVFDAPGNIGDGTKDELIANLTLPLDRFGVKGAQVKAASTWRRSAVTDPTTGEEREISNLKPQEWELQFTHDLPAWRLNWGITAYSQFRETSYRFDQIEHFKLKTFVIPFVEYRIRPDLVVRAEIQNVTERGLRRTQYVYGGPRNTSALAYVEDRDNQFGRTLYIRIRKTLGG